MTPRLDDDDKNLGQIWTQPPNLPIDQIFEDEIRFLKTKTGFEKASVSNNTENCPIRPAGSTACKKHHQMCLLYLLPFFEKSHSSTSIGQVL